jgi:S-(hydroxymethyl)glutathione dehydrogenase/alcohol dehydrogenase
MGEKRIVRSSYGGARPRRDFPWLARLYLEGRLKLDELITQRLPLAQVNDGFAAMTKGNLPARDELPMVVRAVLGLN